jgi:hypothetical protein
MKHIVLKIKKKGKKRVIKYYDNKRKGKGKNYTLLMSNFIFF